MTAKKKFVFLSDIREIVKNSSEEILLGIAEDTTDKKISKIAICAVKDFRKKILSELDIYSNK